VSEHSRLRTKLVSATGFSGFGELALRIEDLEAAEREHQILDPTLIAQLDRMQEICQQVLQKRTEAQ
jgi:hypothetical protein